MTDNMLALLALMVVTAAAVYELRVWRRLKASPVRAEIDMLESWLSRGADR